MAKLGEGLKLKYEPLLEQAPLDKKFHYFVDNEDGTKTIKIRTDGFKLVTDLEEFKKYKEIYKGKRIAFDTETTGLTYGEDRIVGFSLAVDSYSGIYVPIRHQYRIETKTQIDKLDENGNPVLTKSGKVARKTVKTYEYFDCEDNVNPKEALDVLYEILCSASRVIMHNSEFDLNMLKFEGYDIIPIKAFDNLILPYLYDPEAADLAGLKALEKRVLGREVPEFKEVLGRDIENFAFVKPEDGYVYACCDVAGLIGVYDVLMPKVQELLGRFKKTLTFNGVPYNVLSKDNALVKAFVDYYGHAKILIDRQKAVKYKEQLEQRQKQVISEIYAYFDRGMFNLSPSSNEFKDVMISKNVVTGVTTDKGLPSWSKKAVEEMVRNLGKLKECIRDWKMIDVSEKGVLNKDGLGFQLYQLIKMYGQDHFVFKKDTKSSVTLLGKNKESLDRIMFWTYIKDLLSKETEKVKILNLMQENGSLNKALNSYVDKLTQVDECFMKYKLKGTKSGRLSSGNGSKSDKSRNHYYIDLNAQNLTKPKSSYYVAEKCDEYDPDNILGWKFTPVETSYAMDHLEDLYIVEGQDSGITIRGCLKAPEGTLCRAYVPDENGTEEKKVFEVEFDNGEKIQCTKDTVFKVKDSKGLKFFATLEQVAKNKGLKVIGSNELDILKIKNLKCLGKKKVLEFPKGQTKIGNINVYSDIKVGSRYVVSLDYDAEEYKLMAILSRDSLMLSNFAKGIDPHTASAYAIFGEENYDKSKRKKAKIFNFLNNYSGGPYTLSQALDIPIEEAEEMIEAYNNKFHEMVSWKLSKIEEMYQNDGVVFNAFGRPRQFKGWLKVIDKNKDSYTNLLEKQDVERASWRVKSAIERRVASHLIQGTAGDILRLVMMDLYKKYFKNRDPHIDFMSTVHDEINYTIDKEVTTEYVRELEDIMTFDTLDKNLPITTSTDIGFTYGNMFPFVWEDPEKKDTLIPKRTHHA